VNRTLDETDLNIVEVLRTNPRITNKEVAKRLVIAESTVAQRIRSMAERNVMRVIAQKHVFSDGYRHIVFLFVNTARQTVQRVGADISKIEGVFAVSQGIGSPDVFVSTRVRSMEDAQRIALQVAGIDGVETLEVVPCFRIHKFVSNIGDLANPSRPLPSNPESKNDRIFRAFFQDGRQSNRKVSRQLGISESAIRQRLIALQQSGKMQFQVVCDPRALGMGTIAILRFATTAKQTGQILKRLVALDATAFVAEVAGSSNLIALFVTPNNQSLGDITDNQLMSMRGVREADAQIMVAHIKQDYFLSHFEAAQEIPRRK